MKSLITTHFRRESIRWRCRLKIYEICWGLIYQNNRLKLNRLWAVAGATGIVLGAAYMLWLYQRVMFGSNDNPENQSLTDLTLRELATFIPLIILAFWIGLYPRTFLQYLHEPVNKIVEIVRPGEFAPVSEHRAARQ